MRILLTGATGHLGRHVLFEYILQHWDKLETLDIILLGRGDKSTSFEQRMKRILLNDGLVYLKSRGFTWVVMRRLQRFLQRNIRCMECHLKAYILIWKTPEIFALMQSWPAPRWMKKVLLHCGPTPMRIILACRRKKALNHPH